jgi:hypothetical protein
MRLIETAHAAGNGKCGEAKESRPREELRRSRGRAPPSVSLKSSRSLRLQAAIDSMAT